MTMAMQKETEKQGAAAQRVPATEDDGSVGTASTSPLTDDEEPVVSTEDLSYEASLEEDDSLRMTGLEVTYPSQKDRPAGNIISIPRRGQTVAMNAIKYQHSVGGH